MKYYSTRNKNEGVSFAKAALTGLAPDGGLFVPEQIPEYSAAVRSSFADMAFSDLAYESIQPFLAGDIPAAALSGIIESAFDFPCPVVKTGDGGFHILELFHGQTAAFKDFGARFMARAFSYLRRGEDKPLKILVATSGDTGGAVADGFFGIEGITVTVLYPKGRVSVLQEKQIAGLGGNISALAVEGSFDDCQRLVKAAFADTTLRKRMELSSANSINIARLVPQTVYYAAAAGQMAKTGSLPVICVPSGNFGNLTAGLYTQAMGAPIYGFIAATNINKTFVDYIETGVYAPRESVATISNAMDVGAPSNFERMACHWDYKYLKATVKAAFVDDEATRASIQAVYKRYGYILDPHGAVGWAAAEKLMPAGGAAPVVVLETAHPAKFADEVEPLTCPVPVPPALQTVMARTTNTAVIPADIDALLARL
ncbi:MAG: threonine synthase [Spirochaetaceae bacterium]|jgi:threonine synthase|nr:threonine synthase [Spirochaetaceae bacterium]